MYNLFELYVRHICIIQNKMLQEIHFANASEIYFAHCIYMYTYITYFYYIFRYQFIQLQVLF